MGGKALQVYVIDLPLSFIVKIDDYLCIIICKGDFDETLQISTRTNL